jgi:hypothetical protein
MTHETQQRLVGRRDRGVIRHSGSAYRASLDEIKTVAFQETTCA